MKKISIILAIFLVLITTGCSIKINGKEFTSINVSFEEKNLIEKTETKEVQIKTENTLNVSNARGEVVFQKWDKPVIQITAVKKLKDIKDQKKLDKMFEKLKISTNKNSNEIIIKVEYIDGLDWLNYQSVNLNVTVPENVKILTCNTASGNIKAKDLLKLDELNLSSASGSIETEKLAVQNYDIGSSSGSIRAADISGNGSIHAVSGSINMDRMVGDLICRTTSGSINSDSSIIKIDGSTVSGSLNMNDEYIKASSTFTSVSGSVNVRTNKIDLTGLYKLNSTSGGANISIPDNTGFNLNAKSISGNVSSDFDITVKAGENGRRNRLYGTVGNGGPDINIESVSGGIRISRN